ncbi:MAG: tetratricopeptide repeat protein [Treponema sp.]|nr:tetratricopeptide repeat protein [Treponema sp.]
MKRFFLILAVLFACCSFCAAAPSELDIYNELNIYINARYYPGVIEQSELLEKNYPESVFIISARIARGQAQIYLNRYEQAEETFRSVLSSLRFGADQYAECWYYLGQAYYYDGDYTQALSAFHTTCDIELRENILQYYHSSLLYAARIYFFMEQYESSVPLFEYVVSNGMHYAKTEYDEAVQKLMFAWNSLGEFNKTIKLHQKFNAEDFSANVYSVMALYAAHAYEKTGQVEMAYAVLENIQNENFKEMLCSFRLNLGAAAYSKKDYDTALSYFTLARESQKPSTIWSSFIYEQKIKLDQDAKNQAGEVEQALIQSQDAILEAGESVPGLTDSYYSLLMRTKAFASDSKNIDAVLECYKKLSKPGPKDAFIVADVLKQKDGAAAEQLISPFAADTECARLYAQILAANGKYDAAASVYAGLEKNKKLNDELRIEYAKVLYRLKKWEQARNLALKTKHPQAFYIAGLSAYNSADFENAYTFLANYSNHPNVSKEYKKYSDFYMGVCAYKNASYTASYKIFSSFVKFYTARDSYRYKAYELAARSALMIGSLKNAAQMAEGMIDASLNIQDKQNAIIYCSEIYSDEKEYDKAIKLLAAYTDQKSDFAVQCMSAVARVYEKKGELDSADAQYEKIQKTYPGTAAAQDAAYRTGEIYYSAEQYDQAEARFTKYIYNYVDGKYADAAWYFSGDSNMKLKSYDKAIMQNTTLVTKYPQSIYAYGAYKNLLQAYYVQENYRDALATARHLVRNYPEQAGSDGIGQRVVELERITSGTDRAVVEKIGEYERAGKTGTKKGRNAGSELVQLYAAHDGQEQAFELAVELLKYQKDTDEMYYAAQNADFVAGYYYNSGNSRKAAEYYLKAAEYYRASGQDKDDRAAATLYSAVDSFVAAGLKGDAQVTANLLIELYPQSKQSKKVMNLLK